MPFFETQALDFEHKEDFNLEQSESVKKRSQKVQHARFSSWFQMYCIYCALDGAMSLKNLKPLFFLFKCWCRQLCTYFNISTLHPLCDS